jgi:hypothetical protein
MSWDSAELEQLGAATELELAARRTDDTLARYTVMWVVRVGSDLYVRSAYGPESAWYRRAIQSGGGRVRAGGVERDVVLDHLAPDDDVHGEIHAAFHTKYDRYGPQIVGTVVGPGAAGVTLRLDPTHHRRRQADGAVALLNRM